MKRGRDLNRYRCELNVSMNLLKYGVCDRGFAPYFYGYIDRLDPAVFQPVLRHFIMTDCILEPFSLRTFETPKAKTVFNYPKSLYCMAIEGMKLT